MKKSHFLISLILAIVILVIMANLTIFEDGSFWLFQWSGCIPGGLCNL